MATIKVLVDDKIKSAADDLFASLGLDTSIAVRMFISAALEYNGIPFSVRRLNDVKLNSELREAKEDVRLRRNLYGPFKTVDEAMNTMLEN